MTFSGTELSTRISRYKFESLVSNLSTEKSNYFKGKNVKRKSGNSDVYKNYPLSVYYQRKH